MWQYRKRVQYHWTLCKIDVGYCSSAAHARKSQFQSEHKAMDAETDDLLTRDCLNRRRVKIPLDHYTCIFTSLKSLLPVSIQFFFGLPLLVFSCLPRL